MSVVTAPPADMPGAPPSNVEARRPLRLDRVMPYLLVLPTLVIIGALRIYPLIRGAQYSLTGDGAHSGENVGLDNFRELWHDERFIGSMFNTVLSADGPFNSFLTTLHLPTNDWLGNPDTALLTVVAVQLWTTF